MKGTTFIAFLAGAGAGSAATWYFLKTKYEQIAQEEIDSVKKAFSNKEEKEEKVKNPDKNPAAEFARNKPDINEYAKKLSKQGYTNYSNSEKAAESTKNPIPESDPEVEFGAIDRPYVISPEEFGEFDDYTKISLSFFSDHVLTDENYEVVDNVDDMVGAESLNHFGEYEDDSVFVRNDRLKVDYEILLDQRKYSDVVASKPYLAKVWDDNDE